MHDIFVATVFLAMILAPCLVAARTGITGDRDYEADYDLDVE